MHAKSPSSILVSLTIHAFVAALIFLTTVYVAQQDKPPVIFELVAGPPTSLGELVAPALGNSAKPIKLEVPKVEAPPAPEPPAPEVKPSAEPESREETPPAPAPTKAVVTKPVAAKPKVDTSIAQEMKRQSRMSYKDYIKKHPPPKPSTGAPAQRTANVPRIDQQGIAGGVRGGSTANNRGGEGGKALTREEQNELDTYQAFLKNALKEVHEPPPGGSDKLEANVTFDITASGSILNPRITRSSGDKAFDESALDASRRVKSIGPTPTGKSYTWTVTFKVKDMD